MDELSVRNEDLSACRRLKHDLRNAVNSTQLALDVASRMMAAGNLSGAETNLRRAMDACGLLTRLLNPSQPSSTSES